MNNSKSIKRTIQALDRHSAEFGLTIPDVQMTATQNVVQSLQKMPTNYSVNPVIASMTKGKSTFMVKIGVNKVGNGSGNTENPVFLFAANAFNNCARPYSSVLNVNQSVSLAYTNNKNVLVFRYANATDGSTNYTDYTVTLGTKGDYPFLLNSQVGKAGLWNTGVQLEINDVDQIAQLTNEISSFFLNEFGKAEGNDLTTPTDLYQQQNNGIFIPHEFKISGDDGVYLNVLEVDNFEVKMYFYANPLV